MWGLSSGGGDVDRTADDKHRRKLDRRAVFVECPHCRVIFGKWVGVPPGRHCKNEKELHHNQIFKAPGRRGSDYDHAHKQKMMREERERYYANKPKEG
jgi:hypothetical protein